MNKKAPSLGLGAQLVGVSFCTPKGCGFDSQVGHLLEATDGEDEKKKVAPIYQIFFHLVFYYTDVFLVLYVSCSSLLPKLCQSNSGSETDYQEGQGFSALALLFGWIVLCCGAVLHTGMSWSLPTWCQ